MTVKHLSPWNKGFTKETHTSVRKISETIKRRKIYNFAEWHKRMLCQGKFLSAPRKLKKTKELAELIGVILGDGNIHKFPRTECLTIVSNAKNRGFIKHYSTLVEKIFKKEPSLSKLYKGAIRIKLYQKYISKSLKIPTGARKDLELPAPAWILNNNDFLIGYLRGLYEAEGSFCVHKPTSTHKLLFCNKNKSLRYNVFEGMKKLGLHPHTTRYNVQISRKEEVYYAIELLQFRKY